MTFNCYANYNTACFPEHEWATTTKVESTGSFISTSFGSETGSNQNINITWIG